MRVWWACGKGWRRRGSARADAAAEVARDGKVARVRREPAFAPAPDADGARELHERLRDRSQADAEASEPVKTLTVTQLS